MFSMNIFASYLFMYIDRHIFTYRFWQSSKQGEKQQLQRTSGTAAQSEGIEHPSCPTLFQVPSLRFDPNAAPCCRHHLEDLKSRPLPPTLLKGQILLLGTHITCVIGWRQMKK